jgi:circadian clock protein KaiC
MDVDYMKRVPSGIAGLDELILGGFPVNTTNIVCGPAGSAKSLLAMQFIYNGATKFNDPGLYITVEESRENIIRAANGNFGMDIEALEAEGKMYLMDLGGMLRLGVDDEESVRGELIGFRTIQDFLKNFLKVTEIKRFALDSLTAVSLYYNSIEELRQEMWQFNRYLKKENITSILIVEATDRSGSETRHGIEAFIGDSFIALGLEKMEGEYRRSLTVLKMRFTNHNQGKHPFLIMEHGIEVEAETEIL